MTGIVLSPGDGRHPVLDIPSMKIYLDDERPIPQGWLGARWPDEVIALLEAGEVTHLSLDHDLGDDERGTGYDVVLWIEQAVAISGFTPPEIVVHSANSSARIKMELGIESINRLYRQRMMEGKEQE